MLIHLLACSSQGPLGLATSKGISDATWDQKVEASDAASNDLFGRSLAGAGDLDGDGYDDVVVGAYGADDQGSSSGSAYVYYGSASGLGGELELNPSDGAASDNFGYTVEGAGDLDGDGYDDLAVGTFQSVLYVYYGSSTGLDPSSEQRITASDGDSTDRFAGALAALGDVDGDGYDDLAVAAWSDQDAAGTAGSVYVYFGSSAGLDAGSEQKIYASDAGPGDSLGYGLAGLGDVDGDGYADLAAGAPSDDDEASSSGAAYVWYGSGTGIDTSRELKLKADDASWNQSFGSKLAGPGDLDGDGYDDLVVAARLDTDYTGAVYVYFGSASGLDDGSETKLVGSDSAANDQFGYSVAGAGDVDADGYPDLIVGATSDDDHGESSGSAYVYYGSATGLGGETKLTASGTAAYDNFGFVVDGAGDLDGDGAEDVVSSAPGEGSSTGGAFYTFTGACQDGDGDGVCAPDDCDDDDDGVGAAGTLHVDADGDGYGSEETVEACPGTSGTSEVAGDCDDEDDAVNPEGTEVPADGIDSDCDGLELCYLDADGDGYTADDPETAASEDLSCEDDGVLAEANGGDCDDEDASLNPDAEDTCEDGVDNDCDGYGGPDDDEDGDGVSYADEVAAGTDPCVAEEDDTGEPDSGDPVVEPEPEPGCGCASTSPSPSLLGGLILVLGSGLLRRRRRTG